MYHKQVFLPNYTYIPYIRFMVCLSETYISIYITYEITDIKCVSRNTTQIPYKLHFTLLAYDNEKIWL